MNENRKENCILVIETKNAVDDGLQREGKL